MVLGARGHGVVFPSFLLSCPNLIDDDDDWIGKLGLGKKVKTAPYKKLKLLKAIVKIAKIYLLFCTSVQNELHSI